jgi:hypothetical protein
MENQDTENSMDVIGIWSQMGEHRRLQAALALYQDPEQKENRSGMDGIIAQLRHFRPQFVKKLPVEKRAQYASTLPLPREAIAQLIVAYHFTHQRPMMVAFLDYLGIAHENGSIQSEKEPPTPEQAKLKSAVEELRTKYNHEDVAIYLNTLHAQGTETWLGLADLLQS